MNTTTIKPSKPSCRKLYNEEQSKALNELVTAVSSSIFLIISICVILSVWFTQSDGTTKNTLMYTGIFLSVALTIITISFVMTRGSIEIGDCTFEGDELGINEIK
jgi:hypothetical protein